MKPSELDGAQTIRFDFTVPDHSIYTKRSGPKPLPIGMLLPHDPMNTNTIKGRFEKKGKLLYIVGQASQRADRRLVPAPEILQHVSRRAYEKYEAEVNGPRLLEVQQRQLQRSNFTGSVPLSPDRKSQLFAAPSSPSNNQAEDVLMGGVDSEEESLFVRQDTQFAQVNIPKSRSRLSSPSEISVDRNDTADRLTNHQATDCAAPFKSSLQIAKAKRRHKGPFLPDSDSEEQSGACGDNESARDIPSAAAPMAKEKSASSSVKQARLKQDRKKTRETTISKAEEGSTKQTSCKAPSEPASLNLKRRALSMSSGAVGEQLSSVSERKNAKRRKKSGETRAKQDRKKSIEARISKAEEEEEEEEKEWEVKGILDDEIRNDPGGKLRWFLVDWVGEWSPTWEPEENIARDTIKEYHKKKRRAARPTSKQSRRSGPRVGFRKLKQEHFKYHIGKAPSERDVQRNPASGRKSRKAVTTVNIDDDDAKNIGASTAVDRQSPFEKWSQPPATPASEDEFVKTSLRDVVSSDSEDELGIIPNMSTKTSSLGIHVRIGDTASASSNSQDPMPTPLAGKLLTPATASSTISRISAGLHKLVFGTTSAPRRSHAQIEAEARELHSPPLITSSPKEGTPPLAKTMSSKEGTPSDKTPLLSQRNS